MTDRQSTHGHDCWGWGPKHYECAVREIKALRAEVGELHMHAKRRDQYAVEKAAQALDWKKRAERLAETLRPHIEDLEQSAVVLDQYPAMAPTAAEMRKAAAELLAALEQEAGRG